MRLVLVELSRFRSRRAIVLILLAAALFAAFLAATTVWGTRPVSDSDRAAAQVQVDRETSRPSFQRELNRCHEHPRRYIGTNNPALCDRDMTPRVEWFIDRQPLSLANVKGDTGVAVLLVTAALMIIIGTTFAGADWSSGSISNQLLFEPRRGKVRLAKAVAVFVGTLVAAAVIAAAFWAVIYLVAESRGIPTGASVQADIRSMVGRGVLLAGFGAFGGFALTMLLRHTVGTLALMFAYAVGGEALTSSLPIAGVGRWSLGNNVFAWLNNGYRYYDDSLPCPRVSGSCNQMARLALSHGVLYLGVLVLVVVLLSVVFFRRRDVA